MIEQSKKIQFQENPIKSEIKTEEVEINEEKIDRLLHLLHEADPSNPDQDTQEMLNLEGKITVVNCELFAFLSVVCVEQVNSMGPLIDTELERVDRKHAQLTQLSTDLVEALNLYHTLMREPQYTTLPKNVPYGYGPPPPMYGPAPSSAGQYSGYGVLQTDSGVPYMSLPPGPVLGQPPYYQMPPPPMHPPPPASDPNYTQG